MRTIIPCNPRFVTRTFINSVECHVEVRDTITGLSETCSRHKSSHCNRKEAMEMLLERIAAYEGET
jgi:protein subunit release factor B